MRNDNAVTMRNARRRYPGPIAGSFRTWARVQYKGAPDVVGKLAAIVGKGAAGGKAKRSK